MLLNVSFGIFAFLPQGWVFMLSVMLIESLLMSRLLMKKWFERQAYKAVFVSNVVSGIVGIFGSMLLNGGWWLVVWFPWVSRYEVKTKADFQWLAVYYLFAFLLSVLIEWVFNNFLLRRHYSKRNIFRATVIVNVVSYLIGSFILYAYSFYR